MQWHGKILTAIPAAPEPSPAAIVIFCDAQLENGLLGSDATVARSPIEVEMTLCQAYEDWPGTVVLGGVSKDSPKSICDDQPVTSWTNPLSL